MLGSWFATLRGMDNDRKGNMTMRRSRVERVTMCCECSDSGCPVHEGAGECPKRAKVVLRRIDFVGEPHCHFCRECADDALESGVFSS